MHHMWVAKKWKEWRPTTIQKMCALEGMHPNNTSSRCTGEKMPTRQGFLKNYENTRSH